MFNSDPKDVNSLVQYIEDIKPFHSKLTNVTVDYQYDDVMDVSIEDDDYTIGINVSGAWDKTHRFNGARMADLADGSVKYKKWRLPAALFPRLSVQTDHLHPSIPNPTHQRGVTDEVPYTDMRIVSSRIDFIEIVSLTPPDSVFETIDDGFDVFGMDELGFDEDGYVSVLKREVQTVRFKYRVVVEFDRDVSQAAMLTYFNTRYGVTQQLVLGVDYEQTTKATGGGTVSVISVLCEDTLTFDIDLWPKPTWVEILNSFDPVTNELIDPAKLAAVAEVELLRRNEISYVYLGGHTYRIRYHDSIVVTVNGIVKSPTVDYEVSPDRAYVTFVHGREPQLGDAVRFNMENHDRLFVRYVPVGTVFRTDAERLAEAAATLSTFGVTVPEEIDPFLTAAQKAQRELATAITLLDNLGLAAPVETALQNDGWVDHKVTYDTVTGWATYNHGLDGLGPIIGVLKTATDTFGLYYYFEFETLPLAGDRIEFALEQYGTHRGWTQTTFAETLKFSDGFRRRDTASVSLIESIVTNVRQALGDSVLTTISDSRSFHIDKIADGEIADGEITFEITERLTFAETLRLYDQVSVSVTDSLRTRHGLTFADQLSVVGNDTIRPATEYTRELFSDSTTVSILDQMGHDVSYKFFDGVSQVVTDALRASVGESLMDTVSVDPMPIDTVTEGGQTRPADQDLTTNFADSVSFSVTTAHGPELLWVPNNFDVAEYDTETLNGDALVSIPNPDFYIDTFIHTTSPLGTDLVHVQTTDTNYLHLIKPEALGVAGVAVFALSADGSNGQSIVPDEVTVEPERIMIRFATAKKFKVVVTEAI